MSLRCIVWALFRRWRPKMPLNASLKFFQEMLGRSETDHSAESQNRSRNTVASMFCHALMGSSL